MSVPVAAWTTPTVRRKPADVAEFLQIVAEPTPLRRMPRAPRIPLAPAQERMWHAAAAGYSADWNVARAFRIRGQAVNLTALIAAIDDVMRRHAPLRTCYPATASGPIQVVMDADVARIDVRVVDSFAGELTERIAEFSGRAFDLGTEVPIRARVYRLGARDVVLALVVHHISLDGQSIGPLMRDLVTAYLARVGRQAPAWQPLPVDYIDYTLWKHEYLGAYEDPCSRASTQLRYWANNLVGRPIPLELPYDRTCPGHRDATGAMVQVRLDADIHRTLLLCARQGGSSVFMLLQTAFAVAVAAFAKSSDVTVATAVSGRDDPLLADIVGNLADDVLMRIRLDRAADMPELLDQVRRVALAAFANPDTSNPRLLRCLPQDPNHPLFQATLILQRDDAVPPGASSLGGLEVSEIPTGVVRAKHDLEFGLTEHYDATGAPTGIDGPFLYPTALFDPETAERFAEKFLTTVELIATGYTGPIAPLLDEAPRRRPRRSRARP
ncbi:condensation domain-containing protein [Nocardia sp. NBC_01503]|uniref:condensation domain-containing protein n=1 Tax=Nocardia sp. NBC_01503 TaxID=2975997 RepID=UPI002E7C1932|nr:condensation domain-containing protein [Nocardia sp. NBC_01503]WTL29276.1 condensation domain-containing protein [Nocardia sp. NBC_01503]